jgi:hypothetical protein
VVVYQTFALTYNLRTHKDRVPVQVVTVIRTGKRGRPAKRIDPEWLSEAFAPYRRISQVLAARSLGISPSLVYNQRKEHNISLGYSDVTNADLDHLLGVYLLTRPQSGFRYFSAYLRTLNLKIQDDRIRESSRRVKAAHQILHPRPPIQRRTYKNSGPNAVWHCDGHHKLGPWGIVIHGFIDGHTRYVRSICDLV